MGYFCNVELFTRIMTRDFMQLNAALACTIESRKANGSRDIYLFRASRLELAHAMASVYIIHPEV